MRVEIGNEIVEDHGVVLIQRQRGRRGGDPTRTPAARNTAPTAVASRRSTQCRVDEAKRAGIERRARAEKDGVAGIDGSWLRGANTLLLVNESGPMASTARPPGSSLTMVLASMLTALPGLAGRRGTVTRVAELRDPPRAAVSPARDGIGSDLVAGRADPGRF
jgi:hypothetical protein